MRRQDQINAAGAMQGLQSGTYSGYGDIKDWTYYDRTTLDAAVNEDRLFQIPMGQGGKTLADTNMKTQGMIPSNEHFRVKAIKAQYVSVAGKLAADYTDFYRFISQATVEVIIQGKFAQLQVRLMELLAVPVGFAGAADEISPQLSYGRYSAIFPLNKPLVLAGMTPFEVRLHFFMAPTASGEGKTGLEDDQIYIGLNGVLAQSA